MRLNRWFIACAGVLLAPLAAGQQQDFSKVTVVSQKVAEGIYMLKGAGGNIGASVGADGVAIIDDQFAPLAPKIRAALAQLSGKPVRFVINTHWHGDHTGGNEDFGKAGSVIVAQDNVRRRMSVEQVNSFSGGTIPAAPAAALPVITFDQSVTLHWNGDELDVFHIANAHTDGDALIRFRKANVLHMGDIFFQGMYPFIDTGSGGSINGVILAIDRVLPTIDATTRIIPGHGPLADKAALEEYRTMLVTVRDRVAALVKAGKTKDEVLAAKPSQEFDAKWGGGFFKPDVFVSGVYADLKRTATP